LANNTHNGENMFNIFQKVLLLLLILSGLSFAQAQLQWKPVLETNALAFALNPLDSKVMYATANGSFLVSNDGGNSWNSRNNLLPQFEIRNIAVCPADTTIIIIYAAGNLLRSTDGGHSWDIVLQGVSMDGETIEFHPTEQDTMFFVDFYSGSLMVSGDRGKSWKYRANTSLTTVCSFAINPNNPKLMIAGSGYTRVNRSMDGGYTWTTVKDGNDYFSETPKMKWDPTAADRAYGSNYLDENYSVIKIENGGESYTRAGIYGIDMWALDIDPSNGDVYLGSFGDLDHPGVYKSYDTGNSWQQLANIPNTFVWMIKTANDSVVNALSLNSAFGQGGIYQLKIPQLGFMSGTLTDSVSGLAVEYYEIEVAATGDRIIAGNSEGLYKLAMLPGTYDFTFKAGGFEKTVRVTIEAGETIENNILMGLNIRELTFSGTVRGEDDEPVPGIITLNYSKTTTEAVSVTLNTDSSGFFEINNLYSLNNYNQLIIKPFILPYYETEFTSFTLDSMQVFNLKYADVLLAQSTNDTSVADHYQVALDKIGIKSVASNVVLHPETVDPQIVSRTTKNTLIWFGRIDSAVTTAQILDSLQHLARLGTHIIISGQNIIENNQQHGFFNDQGITFNGNYKIQGFIDPLVPFWYNPLAKDLNMTVKIPDQASTDIISYTGSGITKAFYYGNSPADSNNIAGITLSNTGNGGKAVILGFDVDYQSSILFTEFLNRCFQFFDGSLTHLDKEVIQAAKFNLYQNYPNPFNPSTKIRFQIPDNSVVSIKIFDLTGREVATLISNQKMQKGLHSVEWSGKSSAGKNAASGVYFYVLNAGDFSQTRKMILIR
jgi:Sortilin, neurotensin receptor 3,/Secretion system C-terminal sorting domain